MLNVIKLGLLMLGFNLCTMPLVLADREPTGQEPTSTTVTSPSRSFIVRGPGLEQNAHMSNWAERMSGRIGEALHQNLPGLRQQPVILQLVDLELGEAPSVEKNQKLVGPRIQQTLFIHGIEKVDHEEMLEAFCSMMIQRVVWSHTRFRGKKLNETRVPDWFSVGLAQSLLPQLRSRNHDQVYRSWLNQEVLSAQDIIQYRFAAEGRWMEKFSCGIFFEWLSSGRNTEKLLERLMRTWALGEPVTVDVVSAFLGLSPGGLVIEQEWDLWLAYMTRRKSDWQDNQEKTVQKLYQLTLTTSAGLSLPLERLVEYTREPWLAKGAENLRYDIQTLSVGQSREFLEVAAMYTSYLQMIEAMAAPAKKWLGHRPTRAEALAGYERATMALSKYTGLLGKRSQYLTEHQVEKAMRNGARPNGVRSPVDPVFKSYLDRFDSKTK